MRSKKVGTAFVMMATLMIVAGVIHAQTADTGALVGTVVDPGGSVVPGTQIVITNMATGEQRTVQTGPEGTYRAPLLPPGRYRLETTASGFKTTILSDIVIRVTETTRLEITLELGEVSTTVNVESAPTAVQTEEATLGRVVDSNAVVNLPLVTRNFQHIMALSPGVVADVANSGAVGRGSLDFWVHGARATDNSFQIDGLSADDFHSNRPSGVAVPSPDMLQEFKVQTGLWDASQGRQPGANVNIVTKSGGTEFHGNLFHFFRNEALNATPFFVNRAGTQKPILRQNQFGGTFGGPIWKQKLHFFGGYQGTRQTNGLSALSSVTFPLGWGLNQDRSPAAIGAIFGGQSGASGGVAVASDCSNCHPVALAILNATLPDGRLLIPNPQVILPTGRGFSTYSDPAIWNEDQYSINLDFMQSDKSKFTGRIFWADTDELQSSTRAMPGWPQTVTAGWRNYTFAHSYTLSQNTFNELKFGVHTTQNVTDGQSPISPVDVGLPSPNPDLPQFADDFPLLSTAGFISIGTATFSDNFQTTWKAKDSISIVRGKHLLRAGFEFGYVKDSFDSGQFYHGTIGFQSMADFLLGMSAAQNGSAVSNIQAVDYRRGIVERRLRVLDFGWFVQDDWKIHPRLTFNLGLRVESFQFPGDVDGLQTNIWSELAAVVSDPPPGGTLAGYVVPDNYVKKFGPPPAGVVVGNRCALRKCRHNPLGPRFGFAWQPFARSRLAVRGGYGIFYTRLHGNNQLQLRTNQPAIGSFRLRGVDIADRTFDDPYVPSPPGSAYPIWVPRTSTSIITLTAMNPDFQPSAVQQWSLNVQGEIFPSYMVEVAYVGAKGDHIFGMQNHNMPFIGDPSVCGSATCQNSIRGITNATLANTNQRVPLLGFVSTIVDVHSSGKYFYSGLEVSLNKRFSKGLQILGAYTFGRSWDDTNRTRSFATWGGLFSNDNRDRAQAWGRSEHNRPHRFVVSYVYELPGPKTGRAGTFLGGWRISGVTTFQSGFEMTLFDNRAGNIVGWPGFDNGRIQFASGFTHSEAATPGPVHKRLDGYFNAAAFSNPPPVGNGFWFGNSGRGFIRGPDQRNFDIGIAKITPVGWFNEVSNIEFRAEFFNAFNTPQFDVPNNIRGSATFGRITNTLNAPRVIQLALKYNF